LTESKLRYIIIIDNDNITEFGLGINKADLILHPARIQILQALAIRPMNTQELADSLSGIPKSSIYRHLRALLDGGIVAVAETRPVKGVLEKYYRLAQAPHLSQEDVAGFSQEENLRYFTMFLAEQIQGFSDYLSAHPKPNFQTDCVGYTEISFFASAEELERIQTGLRQVLQEVAQNPPAEGRHHHKLAFITFPVSKGDSPHE
jgi:DNA-binding transcriptional ArsR family regulator